MTLTLKKAERKKTKLKLAISAPSGGGKTYSALLLAHGLCNDWEKIAVIDTENESASLYTQLGPYNTIVLAPPFSPERYIEAIHACVAAGMEVIIIDSMSHEWEAEGGALDAQAQLGGKYQDWAKVTPRHNKFMNTILQCNAHVIGTMRRKTDYDMTREPSGKTTVTKVGLKQVQRDGTEYEFTILFALDQNHLAKAEKDRTGLFDKQPEFVITEKTGQILRDWANQGTTPPPMQQGATVTALPTPSFSANDQAAYEAQKKKFLLDAMIKKNMDAELLEPMAIAMKGKTTKDLESVYQRVKEELGTY